MRNHTSKLVLLRIGVRFQRDLIVEGYMLLNLDDFTVHIDGQSLKMDNLNVLM
jgi:hypothetical protein